MSLYISTWSPKTPPWQVASAFEIGRFFCPFWAHSDAVSRSLSIHADFKEASYDSHVIENIMIRLKEFGIRNFKCLLDLTFELSSNVTILTGLNGSGKSTVLQAFDFVGEMMRGGIPEWLEKRGWSASDLTTKIHSSRRKSLIDLSLKGSGDNIEFSWEASFNPNPSFLRCTYERLIVNYSLDDYQCNTAEIIVKEGKLFINKDEKNINFIYYGSVLSQLTDKILSDPPYVKEVHNALANIHSFDLLSPRNIRARSRISKTIGLNGENLAGYFASLNDKELCKISEAVKQFYPWITKLQIKGLQFGWKILQIGEGIGKYKNPNSGKLGNYYLWRESQHINDGTLRLLSIIAATFYQDGIVLLDEIENGFNPYVIEKLVKLLYDASSQLIVTTHSPEILQYIPEQFVRKTVKLLYRKEDATAGIVDLFSLPQTSYKLNILSAGEAYLDINLDRLSHELGQISSAHKNAADN